MHFSVFSTSDRLPLPAVHCDIRRWQAGSRAEMGRQRDQSGPGGQRKQSHAGRCHRKFMSRIPENVLNVCLNNLLLPASDSHNGRRSLHTSLREGRVNPVPRAPTEALASAPKNSLLPPKRPKTPLH